MMSPVEHMLNSLCSCFKQMILTWTNNQGTCIFTMVLEESRKLGSNTAQMLRSNALEKQIKIKSIKKKNLVDGKWEDKRAKASRPS